MGKRDNKVIKRNLTSPLELLMPKWKKELNLYYSNKSTYNYKVYMCIPFDESGGYRYIIIIVYNQMCSADAVRIALDKVVFPTISEGYEDYGVIKVIKEKPFKTFEFEEVKEITKFIFDNYYMTEIEEGGKFIKINNKQEIENNIKMKFYDEKSIRR